MNINKKLTGMILAAAAAATFSMAPALSMADEAAATSTDVKCEGANSCKGQSACKTAENACKGQNSCKGKGYTMTKTQKECDTAKEEAAKAAAPATEKKDGASE